MVKYELKYFNVKGRGEIVRVVLAAAKQEFKDTRYEFPDWANHKPAPSFLRRSNKVAVKYCLAFGHNPEFRIKRPTHHDKEIPGKALPILIIDDKTVLTQSIAIARYLSKSYGFYGKNEDECFKIDEIIDCFLDVFNSLVKIKFSPDSMKEELKAKYKETYLRLFDYMETRLESKQLYFVGDRLTLADIACFVFLESPIDLDADLLKNYPKLDTVRKNVSQISSVADYLQKRPVTDF